MGLVQATLKAALRGQKGSEKCVPQTPYQPLHDSDRPAVREGGLMLEVKALPTSLARTTLPDETYWWTDAQFLPYNDCQLIVTSTAYMPRPMHAWVAQTKVPHGRILLYDLRYQPIKGEIFTGTQSSVYPKVQPHPLGQAIAYTGNSEVNVVSLMNETLYSKQRDMNNRAQHFCAIAPNGLHFAILSKGHGYYYLEIFLFDLTLLMVLSKPVECHKLSPGFVGNRYHNDHAECRFSPDGSHIALSSSIGKLFVVKRAGMKNVCDVCPDLLNSDLSTAGAYDFDPQSRYSVLAVGTADEKLCIVNIDDENNPMLAEKGTEEKIDCVRYNQDGSVVAASFRTFVVRLYDPSDLTELQMFSMADRCPNHVSQYSNSLYPAVMRLSFSFDGRYLATSSCDGVVRVWTVPRLLTLQEWCRKTVLTTIPVSKVRSCDLPEKLKAFLLSEIF